MQLVLPLVVPDSMQEEDKAMEDWLAGIVMSMDAMMEGYLGEYTMSSMPTPLICVLYLFQTYASPSTAVLAARYFPSSTKLLTTALLPSKVLMIRPFGNAAVANGKYCRLLILLMVSAMLFEVFEEIGSMAGETKGID